MAWGDDILARFSDWGTGEARPRWPQVRAGLAVGQAVRGEVIARAPFGVWVDIGAGWPALLQVPEMPVPASGRSGSRITLRSGRWSMRGCSG